MSPFYRHRLYVVLALFLTSGSVAFSDSLPRDEAVNYYALRELANADSPRLLRVMKFSNGSLGKKIIEEGVLVTYKSREAERVEIAGNFSNWRPLPMERGTRGVWYYLITKSMKKNEIRYKYRVDGIWTNDPQNPDRIDDGNGSFLSTISPFSPQEGKQVSYRFVRKGTVEFRVYKPQARFISLVGDFNHWNPENDLLRRGEDGIWRLRKRLAPGEYRYKYVIDGRWEVDYFNEVSASDETGGVCSLIRIPK